MILAATLGLMAMAAEPCSHSSRPHWTSVVRIDGHAVGSKLAPETYFGLSLASPGDFNDDGVSDLVIGAPFDDSAGDNAGAVWLVRLKRDGSVLAADRIVGRSTGAGDLLGRSVAFVEPQREGCGPSLAIGACRWVNWATFGRGFIVRMDDPPRELNGGLAPEQGSDAVRIFRINESGQFIESIRISNGMGGFAGTTRIDDHFSLAIASLGDLDGDGIGEIAVGAPGDNDEVGAEAIGVSPTGGVVWILFLDGDGSVKRQVRIGNDSGGFPNDIKWGDRFGDSLASLGDVDGDGTVELAVGAPVDDTAGLNVGAVWILSLSSDGEVVSQRHLTPSWDASNAGHFGSAVAALGGRDSNGVQKLLIGASLSGKGREGQAWIVSVDEDWQVIEHQEVVPPGPRESYEQFGRSVCVLPDVNGDGIVDFAIGAPGRNKPRSLFNWFGGDDEGTVFLYLSGKN